VAGEHGDEKPVVQPPRHISLAERMRLVLMDLGPSFVKLGQIASTRPDLLPEEWVVELKKLQDDVRPVPFADIRSVVESSLGAPIEEIYESFDEKPLAAASIAQVHRASLKHEDGAKDVAVKVQRPRIANTVARDIEILHGLARFVERSIPESHIYSPCALVDQFDHAITSELDFNLEADNALRFAQNFAGHPNAAFPAIYKQASAKRVLTMEFFDGYKVYDAISDHGHDGKVIARAATMIILKMIFEDGFFHADPHPGNILLFGDPETPRVGMIDLGMVGRLTPEIRHKTIDMMVAAVRKDHEALADALYSIGTATKKIDMRAYRAEVSMLADKYLSKPIGEVDLAAMIGDLVRGATKYGLEIPADFLLVGKTMMTLEGVGKEIDPSLDIFEEARPYFFELLRQRYAPERVATDVWRGLERLSGAAYELPQQLREVMDDLRMERLTIRTSNHDQVRMVDRLGRRVFSGMITSTMLVAGLWQFEQSADFKWVGVLLLVMSASWIFWHMVLDFRRS
jgi:ubiquinone biosynthesis protein